MLLGLETGLRFGLRRRVENKDGAGPGFTALGGAVFALLGLLVAFSFSGAAGRFESKRHLIVEEATAIETAYMRVDLLPAAARPAIREKFSQYVDARLAVYAKLPDAKAASIEMSRAVALQREIWALAVTACQGPTTPGTMQLVMPSLNAMIDISTTRTAALRAHAPAIIFVLLAVVSLVCSFMAGFDASGRKTRSWVHSIGFAAILAIAFYVILDLEYPRVGMIRLASNDQVMIDVRREMK
jgi:hypothetical protein